MTVSYSEDRGKLRIEMIGELGHHEAITAMENIAALYDCTKPQKLVLDMGGVSFMDSSGIAVVMQSKRICDADSADFAVSNASKQALKIFWAAGLTKKVSFI